MWLCLADPKHLWGQTIPPRVSCFKSVLHWRFSILKRQDTGEKYWCTEAFQMLIKSVDEIICQILLLLICCQMFPIAVKLEAHLLLFQHALFKPYPSLQYMQFIWCLVLHKSSIEGISVFSSAVLHQRKCSKWWLPNHSLRQRDSLSIRSPRFNYSDFSAPFFILHNVVIYIYEITERCNVL